MFRRARLTGVGIALLGGAIAFACGGGDHQFGDMAGPGDAGAAGADGSPTSGNGGSYSGGAGAPATGDGGDSAGNSSVGGVPSSQGGSGDGGAGASSGPDCVDGYSDWLTSSFAFPDGDVIGTADFPSMPWATTGSLKIDTGRVSGAGVAIVSQSAAFPYAGSRLRFRARFTNSNQEITAAFNAAKDGSGGVRVELDGYGRLSVAEGETIVAFVDVPPPETGVDWFVEATFGGTSATVVLSRDNYASEKTAKPVQTLTTDALKASAAGTKSVISLAANGTSPAVDEVSFARCGMDPPTYAAKLVDDFERADSATLGKAQVPAAATWVSADPAIKIVAGGLQTAGDLKAASIPLTLPLQGLRIRATVSPVSTGNAPYLWANVDFNVKQGTAGGTQGFWMWGGPSDTSFYTGLFKGGSELKHAGTVSTTQKYYVQMDRDANVGVLTVRQQSFEGPIVGLQYSATLVPAAAAEAGNFLTLSDSGGQGTRFEDIRADVYPTPIQ